MRNESETFCKTINDIKVTVTIPKSTSEAIRRQKINRIYDLLKFKNKTA